VAYCFQIRCAILPFALLQLCVCQFSWHRLTVSAAFVTRTCTLMQAKRLPANVHLYYDGQIVPLDAEQEEVAVHYASALGSQQLEQPETAPIFNKNFFGVFKSYFPKSKSRRLCQATRASFARACVLRHLRIGVP